MNLSLLCAFALLSVILMKVSEDLFPKFKPFILTASGIFFFLFFLGKILPFWEKFVSLGESSSFPKMFDLLLKGFGIALLVSVSSSFCRDLGEEKVAEKLEFCGKAAVLYLSLPLVEYLLGWIGEMVI